MNIKLAIALFQLIDAIVTVIEQQTWYQRGKAATYAKIDAEQRKRIAAANAARADADALDPGGVRPADPDDRDTLH